MKDLAIIETIFTGSIAIYLGLVIGAFGVVEEFDVQLIVRYIILPFSYLNYILTCQKITIRQFAYIYLKNKTLSFTTLKRLTKNISYTSNI